MSPRSKPAGAATSAGLGIGDTVERFELEKAWLVDPVSGREGPGEIVVIDGVLESVVWLEGDEADGVDDKGVVVAPGFFDLHAHFREPGFEDAETVATGSAAAAHGGYTTVALMPNTSPALDEPGVLERIRSAARAGGSPVEILASAPFRPNGQASSSRRWASWPTPASSATRTTGAGPDGQAPAQRASVRGHARPAGGRSRRGRVELTAAPKPTKATSRRSWGWPAGRPRPR
jgi:imidazolonepropionase-like amidohydrolase